MKIDSKVIIEKVAGYYQHTTDALMTKERLTDLVKTRQISMYFLREFTHLSLAQIGSLFNRDHATVLHAITQVTNHSDTEKAFRNELNEIRCILLRYAKFQRCDNMTIDYVLMGTFGKVIV